MANETRSMSDVVERLRADAGEPMSELIEFYRAIIWLGDTLTRITAEARNLHVATTEIAIANPGDRAASIALEDHAGRVSTWLSQFLNAFQELRGAVDCWQIADPRGLSNMPISSKSIQQATE